MGVFRILHSVRDSAGWIYSDLCVFFWRYEECKPQELRKVIFLLVNHCNRADRAYVPDGWNSAGTGIPQVVNRQSIKQAEGQKRTGHRYEQEREQQYERSYAGTKPGL